MYDLRIVRFLLYRSEPDRQKLMEAARQIIKDGTGSRYLDKITEKSFLDRGDDYYIRICYRVERNPEHVEFLFQALMEWYDSWRDDFQDFECRCEALYQSSRLKAWTYCILNGLPELYNMLSEEVSVNLSAEEWADLQMVRQVRRKILDERQSVDRSASDETLLRQLEAAAVKDIQAQVEAEKQKLIRDTLRGKRIGFFTNVHWEREKLCAVREKYEIAQMEIESSLELPRAKRNYDYVVILTEQAKHDVVFALEKMYGREKRYLIDTQNLDLVMNQFIEQLLGYHYVEGDAHYVENQENQIAKGKSAGKKRAVKPAAT